MSPLHIFASFLLDSRALFSIALLCVVVDLTGQPSVVYWRGKVVPLVLRQPPHSAES